MTRRTSFVAAWLAAGIALSGAGCSEGELQGLQARLVVDPPSVDFGQVLVDTTADRQVTLRNDGDVAIVIRGVEVGLSGRDVFSYLLPQRNVEAGQSIDLLAVFTPRAAGVSEGALTVLAGEGEGLPIALRGQGIEGCAPGATDLDGDGYGEGCSNGADCNDQEATVNSGAPELCDGLDNNCDGATDEGFEIGASCTRSEGECMLMGVWACDAASAQRVCETTDAGNADNDGDGFSPCQGDCDDSQMAARPGGTEGCDGIDNDCDGETDEGFDIGAACTVMLEGCEAAGTRRCLPDGSGATCEVAGGVGRDDLDGDGFSPCQGDCDDGRADVAPGRPEACDGVDNNCDGSTDEGHGVGTACRRGPGGSCEIAGMLTCTPGGEVRCSAEDLPLPDGDGDGADCATDCADNDPARSPAFAENCENGIDDDCDGAADGDDSDCPALDCCRSHADCDPETTGRLCAREGAAAGVCPNSHHCVPALPDPQGKEQCKFDFDCFSLNVRGPGDDYHCNYVEGTASISVCTDAVTSTSCFGDTTECAGLTCQVASLSGRNICARPVINVDGRDGESCLRASDCASRNCAGAVCAPTCGRDLDCAIHPLGGRCAVVSSRHGGALSGVSEVNAALACQPGPGGIGLKLPGSSCFSGVECQSNWCRQSRCAAFCELDGDCANGLDIGATRTRCQLTFVTRGERPELAGTVVANVCRP